VCSGETTGLRQTKRDQGVDPPAEPEPPELPRPLEPEPLPDAPPELEPPPEPEPEPVGLGRTTG